MTAELAQKLLRFTVAALLADLVFLQHGRFPSIDGVPVRFLLFACALGAAAFPLIMLNASERKTFLHPVRPWLVASALLLGIALPLWGAGVAWTRGVPWPDVANDANGHIFYLATLPVALAVGRDDTGWLWSVLRFFVVIFCGLSLLLYLFAITSPVASNFIETNLRTRDLGFLNEFTDGRPYRLFFKSYIFVVIVFGFSLHRAMARRAVAWDWVALGLCAAVLWVSYTRSILVVVAITAVFLLVLQRRFPRKFILAAATVILLVAPLVLAGTAWQSLRFDDQDGTVGMRSRQAAALIDSFLSCPLSGAGFGAPVDAKYGFSVELDLLNLLRKVGLVGLAIYIAAFVLPVLCAWNLWSSSPFCPEAVALFAVTFIAVFGMGMANPYATASLGIGAMCIALAVLSAALDVDGGLAKSKHGLTGARSAHT